MRDIQDKTDGTGDILSAEAFNINLINELQDIVSNAGFTLDPEAGPDTDTSMFSKSLVIHSTASQYYQESGVADAYVLSRSGTIEALPSYIDGMIVFFNPGNDNTGPSTINIDAIGVKDLVAADGTALTGGEVVADVYCAARYNSSSDDFELVKSAGDDAATLGGELPSYYATDSLVMHLAGAETVTGAKTFNATINLATDVFSYWGAGSSSNFIRLGHTSSNGDFKVTPYLASVAQSAKVFWFNGTAQEWQIDSVNQYAIYHTGNDTPLMHLAGTETVTGAKTFTADVTLESSSPDLFISETDTVTVGRITVAGGLFYIQAGAAGSGSGGDGDIEFTGYGGGNINSVKINSGGTAYDIWHAGDNPSLGAGNGISGTIDTTATQTITVTNGIITAIA